MTSEEQQNARDGAAGIDACKPCSTRKSFSALSVFLNNLPYALMVLSGAAVLVEALGLTALAWTAGVAFVVYGVAGAMWIILFLCPCCAHQGSAGCPCGYGLLSAKLRKRVYTVPFRTAFKRQIPVIVPLWFIPAAVGAFRLWRRFDIGALILLAAFALVAFVILPLMSTAKGCKECPQRADCPWMGSRKTKP